MVSQITQGIKITVVTSFEGIYLKNQSLENAFSYQITIENLSNDTIQLVSRHWEILDSLNDKIIVNGDGVVGKKPILKPLDKHVYSSGCMLLSTMGAMFGYFNMINHSTTHNFRVLVPVFQLQVPFVLN